MDLFQPTFFVLFFGIFHVVGGLAFGKGVREVAARSKSGHPLLMWGALMGILPTLFDWFFLIRNGQVTQGLIGPVLFVIAIILGTILFTEKLTRVHEKSIGAILMGGIALMIGLMLAPFLVDRALTLELGPEDYIFGSCLLTLPILVGFGFVWNGITAILKNRTLDEHIAEREAEIEEKTSRRK